MSLWLQAFRLHTLPLSFSCILMGSFLAAFYGKINWAVLSLALLTTLFLQVLSNLANDYGDTVHGADNENRVGPQRAVQSGLISAAAMKRAMILFVFLALTSGIALIYQVWDYIHWQKSLLFFVLGVGAIAAAIKYTAGKNPYGYSGWGDFFVFIFFGLVGVAGTFYLHQGQLNSWIWLPAVSVGLLSVGVLNLNNMRDIENDAAVGKRTVVVKMGLEKARWYHFFILFTALFLIVAYTYLQFLSPWQWAFLLIVPVLVKNQLVVFRHQNAKELIPMLKMLALGTFLMTLFFGAGLLLSI